MGWRSDRRWGEYELQEDERYIIIPVMSGIIDISQLNTPPETLIAPLLSAAKDPLNSPPVTVILESLSIDLTAC